MARGGLIDLIQIYHGVIFRPRESAAFGILIGLRDISRHLVSAIS
jgi:hypothetical protein